MLNSKAKVKFYIDWWGSAFTSLSFKDLTMPTADPLPSLPLPLPPRLLFLKRGLTSINNQQKLLLQWSTSLFLLIWPTSQTLRRHRLSMVHLPRLTKNPHPLLHLESMDLRTTRIKLRRGIRITTRRTSQKTTVRRLLLKFHLLQPRESHHRRLF